MGNRSLTNKKNQKKKQKNQKKQKKTEKKTRKKTQKIFFHYFLATNCGFEVRKCFLLIFYAIFVKINLKWCTFRPFLDILKSGESTPIFFSEKNHKTKVSVEF